MRLTLALLTCSLAAACSDNDWAPPETVVQEFLEAVEAGDDAGIERALSARARASVEGASGFAFSGEALESFDVGQARISGVLADVPITITSAGNEQAATMKLRRDGGSWFVIGLGLDLGGSELTIDFEDTESALGGLGEELAEGIASGLEEAFAGAMQEWQNGGSPQEIAAERRLFEALRSTDVEEHDAAWRVDVPANGESVRDVLAGLLRGTELLVDEGVHAALFDDTNELALSGVSRLEAIERLCAELGLHPVYPEGFSWGDELPALTFHAADGPRHVTFAGPFQIEVGELVEKTPHAAGELTLVVRALGLAPAVVAANREMAETVALDGITTASGEELRSDPDTSYHGTPVFQHGMMVDRTSFDLVGLLRGVETLSVSGEVSLVLPESVHAARFEPLREGRQSAGPWTVTATSVGEQSSFELHRDGGSAESTRVLWAPDDAAKKPLGVFFASANAWDGELRASVQTSTAPASLSLKVVDVREQRHAFRIDGVPLQRAAAQPVALAELEYEGSGPVLVRTTGSVDYTNPDFPEVELVLENTSNKAANQLQVTFIYAGAAGNVLNEFPHTLDGEYTTEGKLPVVEPGATKTRTSVAFFVPDGTEEVRVVVTSVRFLDGTRWER